MAKGIIVVDMPESCENCVFSGTHAVPLNDHYFCRILTMGIILNCKKPDWCPVKQMPERLEELKCPHSMSDYQRKGFSRGWNACLDEIEGKM